MSKQRYRLILLTMLIAIFVVACGGANGSQATPTPLPAIQQYEPTIYTVERGPIEEVQVVNGNIVPSRQDDLYFRTSGYITRILVKEGEYVEEGQLLAEMQVDDILNQLEQANIDLELAQANLAKAELARKFAVDRARLNVDIAKSRVSLAELDLDNSYTSAAQERAQLNLDIQRANLTLAEIALEEAIENSDATYEAQSVDRNQLTVNRLEGYLAERQIYAPYDGIVLRNRLREGTSIEAFQDAMTVGDPSQTVVRSPMDYDLRNLLTKDSQITLKLSKDAEEEYTVNFLPDFIPLSDNVDDTSSLTSSEFLYFTVPEDLQGDDEVLSRPVTMEVLLGREEDALLLPPAAIRNYRGLDFVIVVDGDQRRRVEIYEIGLQTPDRYQVIADLQEGDQVLGP